MNESLLKRHRKDDPKMIGGLEIVLHFGRKEALSKKEGVDRHDSPGTIRAKPQEQREWA